MIFKMFPFFFFPVEVFGEVVGLFSNRGEEGEDLFECVDDANETVWDD